MYKKIDEWWKLIVLIICISIFSAIILNLILSIDISKTFRIAENSWVGFWGSLMGSIIGGCVTFIGIKITMDENNEREDKNKKFSVSPYLSLNIDNINTNEIEYPGAEQPLGERRINFTNIDYNYVTVDLIDFQEDQILIRHSTNYTMTIKEGTLIGMLTIENNGLNNAVYIYIEDVSITKNKMEPIFSRPGMGTSESINIAYDILMPYYKSPFTDKCICSGIKVGEKFGIALCTQFKPNDKFVKDRSLHVTIKYNDLLGNTYRQKINLKIKNKIQYQLEKTNEYEYDEIVIDTIEYPDGKLINMK